MPNKSLWLAVTLLVQVACTGGSSSTSLEGYRYRADFFSTNPSIKSVKSELVFVGAAVHSSDTDVIYSFEGCSKEGSLLKLSSSLSWLEFEVDLDSEPKSYGEAGEGDLVLKYDSTLFGETVKVIGIKRGPDTITVVYYSHSNGVLGIAFLNGNRKALGDYIQPIYWLEGRKGICQGL